jgi:tetratricopeptide (TPR) repeat protein
MPSSIRVLACVVGLLAWSVPPARAQVDDPPSLDAVWAAYRQFDYVTAQRLAQTALDAYETPEALAQIHVILGLIAFSRNEQEDARGQFKEALFLDPDVQLDALQVSPKILALFEETRAELSQASEDPPGDPATPRYVLVRDPRAEAALRSMMVPGWGQLYKGQRTKGRVLLGAWGLAMAGGATAHVLRQQALDTYLDAGADEAEKRYATLNRWHKTRNALVMGAIGIWIYSYLDALIIGGPAPERRNLLITPGLSERRLHVSMQVRF